MHRNGCFQLCPVWWQLLQQKLCRETEKKASAKAGRLLRVWRILHSPHLQHSAASILQGFHSLTFGSRNFWVVLPKVTLPRHHCTWFQKTLMLSISFQTMTHEIGHMFGIRHCQWLNCVMQGSNHLEESDRRTLDFCPICLRKLQVSVRFKIAERYKVKKWKHVSSTTLKYYMIVTYCLVINFSSGLIMKPYNYVLLKLPWW